MITRIMSSEEKVKRVYEVMEKVRKDLVKARNQLMNSYSVIKDELSVLTPSWCSMLVDHS